MYSKEGSEFTGCETCEAEKFYKKANPSNPKDFLCEPCSFCCRKCDAKSCKECFGNCTKSGNICISCKTAENPNLNCSKCAIPDVCSQCESAFFLETTSAKCLACPLNCGSCSSQDTCTACKTSFFWDKTSIKCLPCLLNCGSCSSQDSCLVCNERFFLDKTASKCLVCP